MSKPQNSKDAALKAAQAPFLPLLRQLARTYQGFMAYSDAHVRQLGLTPSQFDVISTLGNTAGMSMKDLAAKTLVTKGTLTGIVDRLEKKGLVRREVPPHNRRSFTVVLTEAGVETFETVFPAHIKHLGERLNSLSHKEIQSLSRRLETLGELF
ncbi:MAG: MarR family transcriptional regulator [Cyanobacteria bacterium J06642_2]